MGLELADLEGIVAEPEPAEKVLEPVGRALLPPKLWHADILSRGCSGPKSPNPAQTILRPSEVLSISVRKYYTCTTRVYALTPY